MPDYLTLVFQFPFPIILKSDSTDDEIYKMTNYFYGIVRDFSIVSARSASIPAPKQCNSEVSFESECLYGNTAQPTLKLQQHS